MEYLPLIKFIYDVGVQWCASPVKHICDLKQNLIKLRTSIEELKDTRDDVRKSAEIQEENGIKPSREVSGWLGNVVIKEGQVEEILRKGYEEIADWWPGGFCPINCCSSCKLGKELKQNIEDVDQLKIQGKDFNIIPEALPPPPVLVMDVDRTIGMDSMLADAWRSIGEETVGIIGIYGTGGVGKSTLLKRINNEVLDRGTPSFDLVIWVDVSSEVDMVKIQEDVAKRLGLSLPKDGSLNERAPKLISALSKKKFILLLDNIWERVHLPEIGIPRPDINNKSKVIFTTRSELVCGLMEAKKKISVECLDWPDAWKLFQENVGNEALNAHHEIPAIAKGVAKKCAGLPQALINVGRAMSSRKTPQEWNDELTRLKNSALSDLSGMQKVYPILKSSYELLPDDTTRSCFLYCSLFPHDHSIEIDQLTRYWIGEGLLVEFESMEDARNKGYSMIGTLKQACLLKSSRNSPEKVLMHDVLRGFALWVGRDFGEREDKLLVSAGVKLITAPDADKWGGAEIISLMNNHIRSLEGDAPKCPHLLTLITSGNIYLKEINKDFFQFMPALRVLDLSKSKIEEVPISIVKLLNLQYLSLAGTNIKALPREMKILVKLKILDLSNTKNLEFIPYGILSMLLELQVLDFTSSIFDQWESERSRNGGVSIEELECLKKLKFLSISISYAASLWRLLGSDKFPSCLIHLSINRYHDPTSFPLPTIGSLPNLRKVRIFSCASLVDLSWICGAPNLELLYVRDCVNLQVISPGITNACLSKLRQVEIRGCNALKDLSWLRGAPNMELLDINHCEHLEAICDGVTDGCFPELDRVHITECNALKNLSFIRGAPNLKLLCLDGCKSLCVSAMDGCFLNLRHVRIYDCNALKNLSWIHGATELELLEVRDCKDLELICDGQEANVNENLKKFSRLTVLKLTNLPNLKSIPWLSFPSNMTATMEDCPKAPPGP